MVSHYALPGEKNTKDQSKCNVTDIEPLGPLPLKSPYPVAEFTIFFAVYLAIWLYPTPELEALKL